MSVGGFFIWSPAGAPKPTEGDPVMTKAKPKPSAPRPKRVQLDPRIGEAHRRQKRLEMLAQIASNPINPDAFYRLHIGEIFFGLSPGRLNDAIRKGLIPAPIAPTEGGRAKGWFGRTILEHQRQRLATAKGG
jgi:hypothetical protein